MAEEQSSSEVNKITPEFILADIQKHEPWWGQLKENHDLGTVTEFITSALTVYNQLETAARQSPETLPKTAEEASLIKAIWVLSAHGTYFDAHKNDRYKDKTWAVWNDRKRVNHALTIARNLTELKIGRKLSGNWLEDREILSAYGPLIVYNGRPDENIAVMEAARTPWLRIPTEQRYPTDRFHVINAPIDNLADNIRTFKLPFDMTITPRDEIGIVAHTPQQMRLLFMLNQIPGGFPAQAIARMFPLPTPNPTNDWEYPIQEIRGTTYYRFIAEPHIAAREPYPYKVYSLT